MNSSLDITFPSISTLESQWNVLIPNGTLYTHRIYTQPKEGYYIGTIVASNPISPRLRHIRSYPKAYHQYIALIFAPDGVGYKALRTTECPCWEIVHPTIHFGALDAMDAMTCVPSVFLPSLIPLLFLSLFSLSLSFFINIINVFFIFFLLFFFLYIMFILCAWGGRGCVPCILISYLEIVVFAVWTSHFYVFPATSVREFVRAQQQLFVDASVLINLHSIYK